MQVFILQAAPAKNWTKPKPKNSAAADRALEVVPGHTGELPVRIRAVTYRCAAMGIVYLCLKLLQSKQTNAWKSLTKANLV